MDKPLPNKRIEYVIGHFEHGEFWAGHETYNIVSAYSWIDAWKKSHPKRKVEWAIIEKTTSFKIVDDEV